MSDFEMNRQERPVSESDCPDQTALETSPSQKISPAAYLLDFLEILVFAVCVTLVLFTLFPPQEC